MAPLWLAGAGAAVAGGWTVTPGPAFEQVIPLDRAWSVADVDGDGVADLVLRGGLPPLGAVWLRGLGDGLDDPRPVPDADGLLGTADADGDARVDLLCEGGWVRNDRGTPRGLRRSEPPRAIADLDGDGLPDLVTAGPDTVGWQRGLGAGRFGPLIEGWRERGFRLVSLAVTDLDGDGDPDLVGTDASMGVRWWENRSGTFVAALLPAEGHWLSVADLDGDGDPDLIVTGALQARVVWNDDGAFRPEGLPDVGPAPAAAPADLDGDGDLDVLLASDGLWRLDNLGAGRFGAPVRVAELGASAIALSPLDVDLDGAVDVAVSLAEGFDRWRVAWARNPGPPGPHPWSAPVAPEVDRDADGVPDAAPAEPDPTDPDVDGDGVPDGVELACGRDPTAPDPDADLDCDGDGASDAEEVAAGSPVSEVDFDADGLLDPEEAALGTDPWTWDGDRGGRADGSEVEAGSDPASPRDDWPARNLLRPTGPQDDTVTVSRLAGEFGDVSVVHAEASCERTYDHSCLAWRGRAWMFTVPGRDRTRPPAVEWTLPLRSSGFVGATAGDFDGDGDLDPVVVAETPWNDVERLWLRWTGPTPTERREPLSSGTIAAVAAADLDGDGIDDLLFRDGAGATFVLRATGAGAAGGAFEPPVPIWPALPEQAVDPAAGSWDLPGARHLSVADLNGDGLDDLLLTARTRGGLAWLPRRSDGGWDPPVVLGVARSLPHAEPADVDTDGRVDLLVAGEVGPAAVLFGLGDGAFGPPVELPLEGPLHPFDADGDGDLDLAGWDRDTQALSLQSSPRVFGPPRALEAERRPNAPAATPVSHDVDGDGDLDLIVGGTDGWVLGNTTLERIGPEDPVAHIDGRGIPALPPRGDDRAIPTDDAGCRCGQPGGSPFGVGSVAVVLVALLRRRWARA